MTMTTATTPHFTVEKNRFYREGERYSSGSGFEGSTTDRAQAELWFANFSIPHAGEIASVELRQGSTVLRRCGPAREEATRSMRRAYRERIAAVGKRA